MTTITFDTLTFVEELSSAGVPEVQAKAQARALTKALAQMKEAKSCETAMEGDIAAVRQDIAAVRQDISDVRREISETKVALVQWMVGLALAQLSLTAAILLTMLCLLPSSH